MLRDPLRRVLTPRGANRIDGPSPSPGIGTRRSRLPPALREGVMDSQFRVVLFWVFTSFFVLIGVSSLLVLLGYRARQVDPAFRKWALRTFIGSVTTAVASLFSLILLSE